MILDIDTKAVITQYRDAVRFKLALDLKSLQVSDSLVIGVSAHLLMANGKVQLHARVRDTRREYCILDTLEIDWRDTDEDINGKYPAFWARIKARILAEYASDADLVHPFTD